MKVKDLDLKFDKIEVKVRKGHSAAVRKGGAHQDKTKWSKKDRREGKKNIRNVHEQQILTNVRLTDHQKAVLANMVSRGDQKTTLVDLTSNVADINRQNMTSAVTTLQRVGLVSIDQDRTVSITDAGMSAMQEANLIDESGQLTPEGQQAQFKFARGEEGKTQDQVDQAVDQVDMAQPAPDMGMAGEPMPMGESFTLIKQTLDRIAMNAILEDFKG